MDLLFAINYVAGFIAVGLFGLFMYYSVVAFFHVKKEGSYFEYIGRSIRYIASNFVSFFSLPDTNMLDGRGKVHSKKSRKFLLYSLLVMVPVVIINIFLKKEI